MLPGVGGAVAGMINCTSALPVHPCLYANSSSQVAAQSAEMIAYAFEDPEQQKAELVKHLNDPNYRPDASIMDSVCGNNYTPADAEAIFNTFQMFVGVGGLTKAPKFLKEWPSYARGQATPKQVSDDIAGLKKREDSPDTPDRPNNDRPNNNRDGKSCRARNGKRGGDKGNKGE